MRTDMGAPIAVSALVVFRINDLRVGVDLSTEHLRASGDAFNTSLSEVASGRRR